jgi:DNA repair protein RecN (Recombination protein N)
MMIKYLKIKNYILVKEMEINFSAGLNIFSGETGAGKSVIMEAINTVLGGSIRPGMMFIDTEPAVIEVGFSIDDDNIALKEMSLAYDPDNEDDELSFTKVISPNLKAKVYINGIRSTNSVVKKFRDILMDFHSQRDQQKLFDNDYQLQIIDAFGNHQIEMENFKSDYDTYSQNIKTLKNMIAREKENKDKFELYSYQLAEIIDADIKSGEDNQLQEEYNLLSHSEELLKLQENFTQDCYEAENSIFDSINLYLSALTPYEDDSVHIKNAVSSIMDSLGCLESTASALIDLKNSLDLDPARMQDVQERLDFLNSLKMKYHRPLEELIAYSSHIKEFIENYSSEQKKISNLRSMMTDNLEKLKSSAEILSKKREDTARKFALLIQENIELLAMPQAKVKIVFYDLVEGSDDFFSRISPQGKDKVEIFFSANLGVELQPLKISASGGELSRFLLAVKKILAQYLHPKTIIFDEIDAGIGGKTAEYTGEYIKAIASHHQVICITHLAQIAAFANRHYLINKCSDDKISFIIVKKLDNKNRVTEIARMLSGSDSNLALSHADELLKKTGKDECLD